MAITKIQYATLDDLYTYYNEKLFSGQLPECVVCIARHHGAAGIFMPERWQQVKNESKVHEIVLNPDCISNNHEYWHSTLVHEMAHLWQQDFGKPSRRCYHNKEWADKMESIGLMPSNTGQPGGKRTGQSMSDYVIEGGNFIKAFQAISQKNLEALLLKYMPIIGMQINANTTVSEAVPESEENKQTRQSGVKVKYTCACNNRIWGKRGLNVYCPECEQAYVEHTTA